jgi:hypothetical protein
MRGSVNAGSSPARVGEAQPTATARTLQDQKLMPESKNLGLQNSASSETISHREEYGQHGLGGLPVATL